MRSTENQATVLITSHSPVRPACLGIIPLHEAVLRLRQRDGLPKAGEFRLPFGPLSPLLSCLMVGWLLLQVPAEEAISMAGLISASAVV